MRSGKCPLKVAFLDERVWDEGWTWRALICHCIGGECV